MLSGVGIGLRGAHARALIEQPGQIEWLEILLDNHMAPGGAMAGLLAPLAERYLLAFHCVGLDLGGFAPIDSPYLDRVAALTAAYRPAVVSDHVAFTAADGRHLHDVLPLPYTEEALDHLARRIAYVQDRLGRRILVENPSRYLEFEHSTLTEAEFLGGLVERADCGLLLDLNNAYVSQRNLGSPAVDLLDGVPLEQVGQIHLAGHADHGDHCIDTHGAPVAEPVWSLYADLLRRRPDVPTLIEWDADLPPLDRLLGEARRAAAMRPAQAAA